MGSVNKNYRNVSSDGGKTFSMTRNEQIFGAFFFMSEDIVNHNQNLYTFTQLLSDFGGLFEFLAPICCMIGKWINDHYVMGKVIRALFYA